MALGTQKGPKVLKQWALGLLGTPLTRNRQRTPFGAPWGTLLLEPCKRKL